VPIILITGCSTGIGRAASELFAEKGWTVYAGSRHPEKLHFGHPAIRPCALDVNDMTSIDSFFSSAPALDCVVNNAGYGILLPFENTPPEEIEKMFKTNVFGLMDVSRRAARMMREQKHGKIINISSALGLIGTSWYAAYSASKWAVEGFSESLAHELRRFNVHVKLIEPGGTRTDFHQHAYKDVTPPITEAYKEKFEKKRASQGSKGDYDPPEAIAELIYRAATDDSWTIRYAATQPRKLLFWQRILGRDGLWKRMATY
jgi:NAD(P)-dependent dehydrogenase (short-subunit alcohol dehydrogenase family)